MAPGMAAGGALPVADVMAGLRACFGPDAGLLHARPHVDERGQLLSIDFDDLPFSVRRVFAITDVPAGTWRGGHSHRRGLQAMFCLRGRVDIELRRGDDRVVVVLLPDGVGLRVSAGIWSRQHYRDDGSELLVLATEPYDPGSYDRDRGGVP